MTQPVQAPAQTTAVAATANKLLKPGTKTSEFVTLVVFYAGALATLLGTFNTSNPRMNAILKVAALVAAAVAQVGYALSRSGVKQGLSALAQALVNEGILLPIRTGKPAAKDSGYADVLSLVAGVLILAGLIWLIVGFTHHHLDVFGLILLLVGVGVLFLFRYGGTTRNRRGL